MSKVTAEGRSRPVLVIMGVSGSGKSTLAELLAARLGWDHVDGDDLHPAANVAKMRAGIPLTDADRLPWLARVSRWIRRHGDAGEPGIITCSALKKSYRDELRAPNVVFVVLVVSRQELARRLAARRQHFMPASLLESQLETFEVPAPEENVIELDGAVPARELAEQLIERLNLTAAD